MRAIISTIVTFFFLLQSLLFGGGEAVGKVSLVPQKQSYSQNTKVVQATWYNCTEDKIWVGHPFELEKWDGSQWIVIKPREPIGVADVIFPLEPYQSLRMGYVLSYFDDLQAGRYRIEPAPAISDSTGEAVPVYAEFKLK